MVKEALGGGGKVDRVRQGQEDPRECTIKVGFDFVKSKKDGKWYLLEINGHNSGVAVIDEVPGEDPDTAAERKAFELGLQTMPIWNPPWLETFSSYKTFLQEGLGQAEGVNLPQEVRKGSFEDLFAHSNYVVIKEDYAAQGRGVRILDRLGLEKEYERQLASRSGSTKSKYMHDNYLASPTSLAENSGFLVQEYIPPAPAELAGEGFEKNGASLRLYVIADVLKSGKVEFRHLHGNQRISAFPEDAAERGNIKIDGSPVTQTDAAVINLAGNGIKKPWSEEEQAAVEPMVQNVLETLVRLHKDNFGYRAQVEASQRYTKAAQIHWSAEIQRGVDKDRATQAEEARSLAEEKRQREREEDIAAGRLAFNLERYCNRKLNIVSGKWYPDEEISEGRDTPTLQFLGELEKQLTGLKEPVASARAKEKQRLFTRFFDSERANRSTIEQVVNDGRTTHKEGIITIETIFEHKVRLKFSLDDENGLEKALRKYLDTPLRRRGKQSSYDG